MTEAAFILLVTIFSASVPGWNAEYAPTIVVTNVTNVTLGCTLPSDYQECTWDGPKTQNIRSGSTRLDTKYKIVRNEEDRHCNLTFSKFGSDDEGLWYCYSEYGKGAAVWRVILAVPPKPPIILLLNGTDKPQPVSEFMNVFGEDQAPVVLSLECISSRARPAQESIAWLVNGRPPPSACFYTTQEPPGYFNARITAMLVIHNLEGLAMYSVANVTCVVTHVTGQFTVTRTFGLYDPSRRIELVQEDVADQPGAKRLKCVPKGYPWYIRYYITKERPLPSMEYQSQEVIVTESGDYTCTGVSEGESARSRSQYYAIQAGESSNSETSSTTTLWLVIISLTITTMSVPILHQEERL